MKCCKVSISGMMHSHDCLDNPREYVYSFYQDSDDSDDDTIQTAHVPIVEQNEEPESDHGTMIASDDCKDDNDEDSE